MEEKIIKQITSMVIKELEKIEKYKVPIGVSNRHVHLTKSDFKLLFGGDCELTKKSELKQPSQFAANETVTLRGQKGEFKNVRILGPFREQTQVEVSITDSFRLGIKPPIKESGMLRDTPGLEIIGPKGSMKIPNGTIVALRHIHMTPKQAEQMGLKDKDIVEVETFGERRGVLGNVLVRVKDNYVLEMHVDIDEANASALKNGDYVVIRK